MEYWIKFISVVVAVCLSDICWTYYFIKIEERKALLASMWSSLIILLGAFSIEKYVTDKSFIIAAAIGAFIGTYLSIWYKKKQTIKNK